MRLTLVVLMVLVAGCCSTGTKEPQSIYKLEHRLTTTDGVQSYESEVVKVPYPTP